MMAKNIVPRTQIARCPGDGIPDELHVTLTYSENLVYTSTTGSISAQSFYGSDCFDPNVTGAGGQPAWFDTFIAMYDYGVAFGSRFIMRAKASSSTVPGSFVVVPLISSGPSALADMMTNPLAAEAILTINQPMFLFDMVQSWMDLQGTGEAQLRASSDFWFTAATSPPLNWIWRVKYQSTDGASTSTAYADTIIKYRCMFFRRKASDVDFDARQAILQRRVERERKHQSALVHGRYIAPDEAKSPIGALAGDRKDQPLAKSAGEKLDKPAAQEGKFESKTVHWSEEDESDEAIYADFLRWKRSTSAAGAYAAGSQKPLNDQTKTVPASLAAKTGVG